MESRMESKTDHNIIRIILLEYLHIFLINVHIYILYEYRI